MLKSERGKTSAHWLALYPKDEKRFQQIRSFLEARTGRPASATSVMLHLLDCYDDLMELDVAMKINTIRGQKQAE